MPQPSHLSKLAPGLPVAGPEDDLNPDRQPRYLKILTIGLVNTLHWPVSGS